MTTDIHRTHQTIPPGGAPVSLNHAETDVLETFIRALALQTITEADHDREETQRDTRR
ncbi:hypothetical protein [Rhodococcus opacus]|uniref:hypothetical protein n=1 Tax=Rhodococcus opacus TaxID=37919 RepID=UPI001F58BC11|nr:hypothetical protein [Rhodococcus opacus]UNN05300.1 hypothetical protein MOO23_41010 [Rhodococcus opacus]